MDRSLRRALSTRAIDVSAVFIVPITNGFSGRPPDAVAGVTSRSRDGASIKETPETAICSTWRTMRSLTKPTPPYDYQAAVQVAALRNYRDSAPGRAIPPITPGTVLVRNVECCQSGGS